MNKWILLLIYTVSVQATGNLIFKNYDQTPIIALIEGLPDSNQCILIAPQARTDYPSTKYTPSIDTFNQRVNGWVKLYHANQFDPDPRKALRLCNRERIYLKHTPIYKRWVQIPSPYYTPNIQISWPDDAIKKLKQEVL